MCATGIDFDTSDAAQQAGPTLSQINAEIVECNAGTGSRVTSSAGWVSATGAVTPNAIGKLAIGEDNSTAGLDFPLVCASGGAYPGIDPSARWMWYSSTGVGDPFVFSSLDASRPFLIFRLAAGQLPRVALSARQLRQHATAARAARQPFTASKSPRRRPASNSPGSSAWRSCRR